MAQRRSGAAAQSRPSRQRPGVRPQLLQPGAWRVTAKCLHESRAIALVTSPFDVYRSGLVPTECERDGLLHAHTLHTRADAHAAIPAPAGPHRTNAQITLAHSHKELVCRWQSVIAFSPAHVLPRVWRVPLCRLSSLVVCAKQRVCTSGEGPRRRGAARRRAGLRESHEH